VWYVSGEVDYLVWLLVCEVVIGGCEGCLVMLLLMFVMFEEVVVCGDVVDVLVQLCVLWLFMLWLVWSLGGFVVCIDFDGWGGGELGSVLGIEDVL